MALISNDEVKNELIDNIVNMFSFLYSYNFSTPAVNESDSMTSIDWFMGSDSIAIEIEIDWRDFDIFVLLVRLQDKNLPNGYYVSDGVPCRYHLQQVITDRGWNIDPVILAKIVPGKNGRRPKVKHGKDELLKIAFEYKVVVESCISRIVEDRNIIFKN